MLRPLHVLAALALASGGCLTQATEVLVQVDTDIPADVPLTIRATVRAGTVDISDGVFEHNWQRGADPGGIATPATFAITPGTTNAHNATVTLLVEADGPDFALRREARFAFSPGLTTSVTIFLSGRCLVPFMGCTTAGVACTVAQYCQDHGQTCDGQGACVGVATTTMTGPPGPSDAGTFEFREGGVTPDVPFDSPMDGTTCGPGLGCCSATVTCTSPQICTSAGACAQCGAGRACCTSGHACTSGQVCSAADACVACGAAGQPCCAGSTCAGGGTCMAGMCNAPTCGASGQACCASGAACGAGLACTGGTCHACGGSGEPCCAGSSCSAGFACSGGTCACVSLDSRCAAGDTCCGAATCSTLNSDGLPHCCLSAGQRCGSSMDCCGALYCCNLGGAAGLQCHAPPCP